MFENRKTVDKAKKTPDFYLQSFNSVVYFFDVMFYLRKDKDMPITKILEQNAKLYGNDTALIEINPQELEKRHTTWREYSLIESSPTDTFRSEITWQ